jgi:DNA-binding transcriptional ArsR family regulator
MPEREFMFAGACPMPTAAPVPSWTLLSNHGRVLACLACDPAVRLRDVALSVGLTERAVQKLLGELAAAGLVTRSRVGRRNRYQLHRQRLLGPPAGAGVTVGQLLAALAPAGGAA